MDTPQPDAPLPRLVPQLGGALATRRLLDTDRRVQRMVRSEPVHESDSGWSFVAGTEPEEELQNPENVGVVDIDVVAQVDPDIIPFLTWSVGTVVERDGEGGPLRVVHEPEGPPEVRLMMPIPAGPLPLGEAWAGQTPAPLMRRMEGDDLVLWRDGLTLWIAAFFGGAEVEDRIQEIADGIEGEVTSMTRRVTATYGSLFYEREGADQTVRYAFFRTPQRELHLAAAYADARGAELARAIGDSVEAVDLG